MILSVIIVNYQVPYFLELCLHSVTRALRELDAEIIVVDNHSADNSVELLRPLFPQINWLVNTENTGFARANNQALRQARGKYILFLNPDTIVPEDFAQKCLSFIQSLTTPGGLGVRMIDGSGRFLKESRRGLPTPWVAFCKLSGLTTLFPHSRWFARYYLDHLPQDQTSPAPILSGAFLFVSRTALDQCGQFDETFFMYGEDIDLSYRLEKAGCTNYYFPGVTIIHFKGESTRKDIRYIRQFYKSMSIFRRKHFHTGWPALPRFGMEMAIWLRAGMAAIGKFITPKSPRPRKPRHTWISGDPAGIARLQSLLSSSPSRTPAPDERQADEIIYCVGKEFSFKSAIQALEQDPPAKITAFCAPAGHAVVSSARRDNPGEIWIL